MCAVKALFGLTAALSMLQSVHAVDQRIVIAGDSTASWYPPERAPQAGWGQALPYFLGDGVRLDNRAVSGRSTKSYIDEGRWAALLDALQPDDIVLISFGHNDSRDDDPKRFAAPAGAYRQNLTAFIADVRAAGARPVIVSSVARRLWEGPAMVETHGLYRENARLAAREMGADYIDLAQLSINYFEAIGREETKTDYLWLTRETANARFPEGVEDNTHFSELGACGVARIVASEIHALGIDIKRKDASPGSGANASPRPAAVRACAAWLQAERRGSGTE